MISVQEASKIILEHTHNYGSEEVNLLDSVGRLLAEDVTADRDFPPFHRVAMDGICFRFEDFENGTRQFNIQATQAAGEEKLTLKDGYAIEIMTGASLPHNADVVVRYEDLDIESHQATINLSSVNYFQNIHQKGSDKKLGDTLIRSGKKIDSAVIGVLATVGKHRVAVKSLPKVAIISTGDELVDIEQIPNEHQIRKSNVYSLEALLVKNNIQPDRYHLPDNKVNIHQTLEDILNRYDAVLLSGAVSKGKFDFIPEILDRLNVQKLFNKVAQRPGKPFWFGIKERTCVFAFPGNPVSTFVCAIRYFLPWLVQNNKKQLAILAEDLTFKPSLTNFLQVELNNVNGCLFATPSPGNGSGDLANLALVDALIELPSDITDFKKGSHYPIWFI